jgi:hypothetical protein
MTYIKCKRIIHQGGWIVILGLVNNKWTILSTAKASPVTSDGGFAHQPTNQKENESE